GVGELVDLHVGHAGDVGSARQDVSDELVGQQGGGTGPRALGAHKTGAAVVGIGCHCVGRVPFAGHRHHQGLGTLVGDRAVGQVHAVDPDPVGVDDVTGEHGA